jgi:hypothetical protein
MNNKRRVETVLRTGPVIHDDGENTASIVRRSWQDQQHQSARRVAAGRRRKSGESLN